MLKNNVKELKNMSTEEQTNLRAQRAEDHQERIQNMSPEVRGNQRINRTQQEVNRIQNLEGSDRESFNQAHANSQHNYCNNEGTLTADENYIQYLSSFNTDNKLLLEEHPYMKQQ